MNAASWSNFSAQMPAISPSVPRIALPSAAKASAHHGKGIASTDGAPYYGYCSDIAPDYAKLVGLNLMHGFRKALKDRLGGTLGCSHMSELVGQLPTVALQTFASEVRDNEDRGQKPFQLDRCRALDTHGEVARRYYPRWHKSARTGTK